MTTASIRFKNYNDQPIHIQVDPVAGWYLLKKGQEIEIVSEIETSRASFDLIEDGDIRYLLICHSNEYFVVLNGRRIHCSEYLTNVTT